MRGALPLPSSLPRQPPGTARERHQQAGGRALPWLVEVPLAGVDDSVAQASRAEEAPQPAVTGLYLLRYALCTARIFFGMSCLDLASALRGLGLGLLVGQRGSGTGVALDRLFALLKRGYSDDGFWEVAGLRRCSIPQSGVSPSEAATAYEP
jgi:hypothetical protein